MTLIIDTSSEDCLLALSIEGNLAASTILKHANNLSATLVPSIKELIDAQGMTLQELCSIAVGIGPGSYTGTRVGVAVAKTLSFGLKIPLTPFCSLLAGLPEMTGSFACFMPARSQDIFILKGTCAPDTIELSLSALLDRASAIETLKTVDAVIGPPSEEIPVKCHPCTPGFESILKWLNHCKQIGSGILSPQADLIYLHTP